MLEHAATYNLFVHVTTVCAREVRLVQLIHFGMKAGEFHANKKLLGAPGIATRSKDATKGSLALLLGARSY